MSDQPQGMPPNKDEAGRVIVVVIGAGLVLVGLSMLAREFVWPAFGLERVWSFIRAAGWGLGLIIVGIIAIIWTQRPGFKAPERGARLYRSRSDRVLGGVLGGVADYLGMDPTLVRLAFVGLSLMFGVWPAVIAYIAALIIVPEAPLEPPAGQATWPSAPPAPPPYAPPPPAPPPAWPEGSAAPYVPREPPPAPAPEPPTAPAAAPPAPTPESPAPSDPGSAGLE